MRWTAMPRDVRWKLCTVLGCPRWVYKLVRSELGHVQHDAAGRVSDPGAGSPHR